MAKQYLDEELVFYKRSQIKRKTRDLIISRLRGKIRILGILKQIYQKY